MDMESIVLEFWACSLRNDFSEFDWAQAFCEFEPYLDEKVRSHAQGTFEEYVEFHEEMYCMSTMECDIPDWAQYDTSWGCFSDNDAVLALLKAKYDYMHELFVDGPHGELADLRERIQFDARKNLSQPELITLFDECIHAQHCNGDILEDFDVESLRDDAEAAWEDEKAEEAAEQAEKDRFPTQIREFLTV